MVAQIVFPCFLAIFCKILTIFTAVKLSKPDVGSSRSKICGSVINSTPIAVHFLSPPEIVFNNVSPTTVSAHSLNPRSTINSEIF